MKRFIIAMAMMLLTSALNTLSAQESEIITNDSIISFLNEGLTSNDIIGIIKTTHETNIHYSAAFLHQLKKAGADQDLTSYLVDLAANANRITEANACQSANDSLPDFPGIFWMNTYNKEPVPLTCNTFTKEENLFSKVLKFAYKTLENLSDVAWGSRSWHFLKTVIDVRQSVAGKALEFVNSSKFESDHLVLNNPTAAVQMVGEGVKNPEFRFQFGNTNGLTLGAKDAWLSTLIGAVDNPSDFVCVKLDQKSKERTLPSGISVGSWFTDDNIEFDTYKGKVIPFKSSANKDGSYNVKFTQPLEPGEYCFFYKNFKDSNIGRIVGYDFSVH